MMRSFGIVVRLVLLLVASATPAFAELTVDITQGAEGAMPIAIVPFQQPNLPGDTLSEIVAMDLHGTGKFAIMRESQLPQRPVPPATPDFPLWQSAGQEHVVIGRVLSEGSGMVAEFVLYDAIRGVALLTERVPFKGNDARHAAHRIADMIYKQLTGQRGVFNTRVAYVSASGYGYDREYRLVIADTDGEGDRIVMTSPEPIMSPNWSPDGKRIAYVSFEDHSAAVFVQNLSSGERRKVSSLPGINGAPAWSPDGSELAVTLSKDGSPDIYVVEVGSGAMHRITNDASIDTEASWSPDGRSLVFTSDRGGKPQLYLVSANGGEAQRLTYDGAYNARGVFSPDGRSVAMVHGGQGGYRIAVMDLGSRKIRVLSSGRLDESPAFAPNGEMILYTRKDGGLDQLAVVSVDGKFKQNIHVKGGDIRGAAWSP
jgi:TolB protein